MQGGEVFVPKIPSMTITDLANTVAPDAQVEVIGIRPARSYISAHFGRRGAFNVELENMYIVQPAEVLWFGHTWEQMGNRLADDYRYASNTNTVWLSIEDLKKIIAPIERGQIDD
jgi:UDP-N-acetylglucosamine 4,6-dehydratase